MNNRPALKVLRAFALMAMLAAVLGTSHVAAAEGKVVVGSNVQIELNDKSIVKGTVLDLHDDFVSLKTKDGDFKYDRKNFKRIDLMDAKVEVIPVKQALKDLEPDEAPIGAARKVEKPKAGMQGENDQQIIRALASGKAPAIEPKKIAIARGQIAVDASAPKNFEQAVRAIEQRNFKLAGSLLRDLVTKSGEDEISRADALSRDIFSLSLADMLVRCYLNELCQPCKGEGVVTCGACSGVGYNANYSVRVPGMGPTPGVRKTSAGAFVNGATVATAKGTEARSVTICDRCRGNGYDPCGTCRGTRVAFTDPTPYEREAYSTRLKMLGNEALNKTEVAFGESGREQPPAFWARGGARLKPMMEQVWLRDSLSQVKSDVMRMLRAETFYLEAMKCDPTLVFRENRDMQQEITRIRSRKLHLQSELSERFQVYAQNRTEHFLDELEFSENFGGPQKPNRTQFIEVLNGE